MNSHITKKYFKYSIMLYLLHILILCIFTHNDYISDSHIRENGFYEAGSFYMWLACSVAAVTCDKWLPRYRAYMLSLLMILLALRENDWQRKFTSMSVFKVSFFTQSPDSHFTKTIAFSAVIIFVFLIAYFSALIWNKLKKQSCRALLKEPYIYFTTFSIVMVVSKTCDRICNLIFESLNIALHDKAKLFCNSCEESLELLAPCIALFGIVRVNFQAITPRKIT